MTFGTYALLLQARMRFVCRLQPILAAEFSSKRRMDNALHKVFGLRCCRLPSASSVLAPPASGQRARTSSSTPFGTLGHLTKVCGADTRGQNVQSTAAIGKGKSELESAAGSLCSKAQKTNNTLHGAREHLHHIYLLLTTRAHTIISNEGWRLLFACIAARCAKHH
eukprot:2805264-Amphidinium_carterae.1